MTLIVIIKTGVKGIVAHEFIWSIYRLIFLYLWSYVEYRKGQEFSLVRRASLFLVGIITFWMHKLANLSD